MEIRGPNHHPYQGPTPPESKPASSETSKPEFDQAMQGPEGSPPSSQAGRTGGPEHPLFERMSQQIHEGINAGEPKPRILERVVEDQLKDQFGQQVTAEMTEAVASRFQSDPKLSQLFNRLYAQAARAGGQG